MPNSDPNKITFEGLKQLLIATGFELGQQIERALPFQHPETGTWLLLSIPPDGFSVRPADLLSILVRLEAEGLMDENAIADLKSGRLPVAS